MNGTHVAMCYIERFPDLGDREDWAVCVTAARVARKVKDINSAERLGKLANRRLGECVITAVKTADLLLGSIHRANKLWRRLRAKTLNHAFRLAKGELQPLSYGGMSLLVKRLAEETAKVDFAIHGCETQAVMEEAAGVMRKPLSGHFPIVGRKRWLNWERERVTR